MGLAKMVWSRPVPPIAEHGIERYRRCTMWDSAYLGCTLTLALVLSCGGAPPQPAESAEQDAPGPDNGAGLLGRPDSDGASSDETKPAGDAATPPSSDAKPADVPAPAFKENGSVKEAIDAVPQGTQRLNLDQEALGRPLGDMALYEPCKPGSQHFKAKVAVWDGKAVGLDLTTTPKSQKFADCIAERIRSLTWPDKVKSLNIVEYSY